MFHSFVSSFDDFMPLRIVFFFSLNQPIYLLKIEMETTLVCFIWPLFFLDRKRYKVDPREPHDDIHKWLVFIRLVYYYYIYIYITSTLVHFTFRIKRKVCAFANLINHLFWFHNDHFELNENFSLWNTRDVYTLIRSSYEISPRFRKKKVSINE